MSHSLTTDRTFERENSFGALTFKPAFSVDRRQEANDQSALWDKLNLSQQFSVCSLGQFGYVLIYVRNLHNKTLAILTLENKTATINEAGDINISPKIQCR